MNAIKLYFLSSLFLVAGVFHVVTPHVFNEAVPDIFFNKYWAILITGLIEFLLAAGLIIKRTRDFSARYSALYLLCLVPVHVYVSIFQVEMFGISSPIVLWGRTLFQFVLVYLALSLQDKGPLIFQRWKDVVFLHYKISATELQKHVPFTLDLFEGNAIVSIVPFMMDRIRFPFLPWVPGVSKLWELNLRTYVTVNGIRGVYFFTLETDSLIGQKIAQNFFHLPYRYSQISARIKDKEYFFQHSRGEYSFSLKAATGAIRSKSSFETWVLERYHLFLEKKGKIFQGTVSHHPWPLQDLVITIIKDQFSNLLELNQELTFISASYTKEISVSFAPFKECSPIIYSSKD